MHVLLCPGQVDLSEKRSALILTLTPLFESQFSQVE